MNIELLACIAVVGVVLMFLGMMGFLFIILDDFSNKGKSESILCKMTKSKK